MSGKTKLQKIDTQYINDKQTATNTTPADQDTQIKFIEPAKDVFIDPIPQREVRIRSSVSAILDRPILSVTGGNASSVLHPDKDIPNAQDYLKMRAADRAIEGKASELDWIGPMTADLAEAGTGYVIRYLHADIYYSKETGTHIVNGDIRAKYNLLGAAESVLGLPVTSESTPPDGFGRFNHFQGGSIYWTESTGPMVVRGPVRDKWASLGWETALGYPVSDIHRKGFLKPLGRPEEYSSIFQKGAIYSKGNKSAEAFVAELEPFQVAHIVRKLFDKALKEEDDSLGIEGAVKILNVSSWGFDFWASRKRVITFEINGFFSTGDFTPVPDPTFYLKLEFLCGLARATPANTVAEDEDSVDRVFVIYLYRPPYVHTSGVGNGELFKRLNEGINKRFPFPVRVIPADAKVMDFNVTPQGGLQFFIQPGVEFPGEGSHLQQLFQTQLNNLYEQD